MDGFVAPAPRRRIALPRRSLRGADDRRLVAQVRSADESASRDAFEVLYDRHHRGVLGFCRHMLGSLEEAEDAVQHTFSSAYRALLADEREIALRAWLYAIARNRCLSMLGARREQVALDDVEGALPSTAGLALEVEQRNDLRELLADLQRLPDDQRAALVLSELEAHSHKEIADILGVPPAKVKALVFQARETLMSRRQARDTDCREIREQLSVLRGGALRRRELRRHVESCEGCQAFEADVRRQRAGMAVILPVAPTLALKHSTLASAFAAGGTSAAAGGAGALTGGGVVAGGLAAGTKAVAAKTLVVLAVAGSAGGGGYVAVNELRDPAPAPSRGPAQVQRSGAAAETPAGVSPVVATTPAAAAAAGAATPAKVRVSPATAVDGRERAKQRSDGRSGGTASAGRSEQGAAKSAAKKKVAGKSGAARDAARKKAAARRAAARAAARREAARRAAAERARALEEAARKRAAAEAARRAKQQSAAPAPAVTPPPPPAVTPTVPTAPATTTPSGAPGRAR